MDEMKQRLKDASDACISTYEAWCVKPGDHALREALQDAVHELRKVGARLEIELAVSDRKNHGNEPIPIPSHRASRSPAQSADIDMDEGNSNARQPGNSRSNNNFANREGGRENARGAGRRPVAIKRSAEAAPAAAPESADDDGAPRAKPLSLKRSAEE